MLVTVTVALCVLLNVIETVLLVDPNESEIVSVADVAQVVSERLGKSSASPSPSVSVHASTSLSKASVASSTPSASSSVSALSPTPSPS